MMSVSVMLDQQGGKEKTSNTDIFSRDVTEGVSNAIYVTGEN